MEKTKIDRIIDAFRTSLYQEFGVSEDSPTMSSGSGPAGFSGAADSSLDVKGNITASTIVEFGVFN
jgi:hypothetical protein